MKNRIQKMKDWMSDHPEAVAITGVCAFYALLIGAAIKVANDEQKRADNTRRTLIDAINDGKTVLPNTDGSFWIIDRPAA